MKKDEGETFVRPVCVEGERVDKLRPTDNVGQTTMPSLILCIQKIFQLIYAWQEAFDNTDSMFSVS